MQLCNTIIEQSISIMVLNLSKRQMNNYVVNLVLLAVVILSWVYVIIAGTFISERHLNNLLSEKEILEDVVI